MDEKIDKGFLRCFGNVERMEKDRIAKKVLECAGIAQSVGREED